MPQAAIWFAFTAVPVLNVSDLQLRKHWYFYGSNNNFSHSQKI
jgi:hypothetical protein